MILPYLKLKTQLNDWRPRLAEGEPASWTAPGDLAHGLLTTNLAFRLSGRLKHNPAKIAQELLDDLTGYIAKNQLPVVAGTAGPYINVWLTTPSLSQVLAADTTKHLVATDDRQVMLEYIGANVAKRLHAGHMRNLNIGDALRRILHLKYPHLVTDNHWGDWGVQFGVLLWAYKQAVNHEAYLSDPIAELQRLYVWGSAQEGVVPDWKSLVRDEFVKLEQGDPDNRRLWQEFVGLSKDDLKSDLALLGVPPTDLEQGESFYEGDMQELTKFLDTHQIWKAEGKARYFDFEELAGQWPGITPHLTTKVKTFGRCYLISSDGYTSYAYRDVAARLQWARDLRIDLAITITDKTQGHNFDQAFAIISYLATRPEFAAKWGQPTAKRLQWDHLVHIGYGYLQLISGKMSTRQGNVLRLADLVKEVQAAASRLIVERDGTLPATELARRSSVVAVASLKWADLNRDPQTDVVLDPARIVEFEGNTGAYQLYTYARLRSVLRKADEPLKPADYHDWSQTEVRIIQQLYILAEAVQAAADNYKVNAITTHLQALASLVNAWYVVTPILKEPSNARRNALLNLCQAVTSQMAYGLNLLGINILEEM